MKNVKDKVVEIINTYIKENNIVLNSEIDLNTSLSQLGLSSYDVINVLISIENKFQIIFPSNYPRIFKNISTIIEGVEEIINSKEFRQKKVERAMKNLFEENSK